VTTGANVSLLARLVMRVEEWKAGAATARAELGTLEKSLTDNAAAARAAGVAFTAMIGAGIAAATAAVNTFAGFEQAIQNVASVAGATASELEKLREAAIRVGGATRLDASQAADALYNLASAGFDTTQSLDALDGVTNLALATLSDLGTASGLTTSTITQFALATDEAGRVADTFVNAIARSPANMTRLVNAMRDAGPIASSLGISLEETVAAVSTLFKAGLEGGQAGASLRFFLAALVNPTDQAAEVLDRLNISLESVNPQIVGVAGAMETLEAAGLTVADGLELFSTRGAAAFLSFRRQGSESIRALTEEVSTVGTAARIAQEQMDTLSGSVENLMSSIETVQIVSGGFIAKIVRPIVDGLNALVGAFGKLPGAVQVGIGAIVTITSALAAAALAFLAFGGVVTGVQGRFATMIKFIRAAPNVFRVATVSLIQYTASLVASTRAALAFSAAQSRMVLANLTPGRIIPALRLMVTNFIAATAALLGFNTAGNASARIVPRITAAMRALFVAMQANPIIAAVTLALAGLLAVVAGVRSNFGGLGDAWAMVTAAARPLLETVARIGTVLAGPLTEGLSAASTAVSALAPLLGGVLLIAARGLALLMVQLAASIEGVANGAMFLEEVFTAGPMEAARRFTERARASSDRLRDSMAAIVNPAGNAAASLQLVGEATEDAARFTGDWITELSRVKESFEGQELIDELTLLLEHFQDNEKAVETLAAAIADARTELEALTEESARLVQQFDDRLQSIKISLIEDDEVRRIEETRVEFARLRREIEEAAATNSVFAIEAPLRLAESYSLEAAEIAAIRREAADEEREERERLNEEIVESITERQSAIRTLEVAAITDRVARVRAEFEDQYRAVGSTYDRLEERARGNAVQMARIAELRTRELRAIEAQYVADTIAIWDDAYDRLAERGRTALRDSLRDAGDERGLLSFDYDTALRESQVFYDDLADLAGSNAALLASIEEERGADRVRITAKYQQDLVDLARDTAERIASAEARVNELRVELDDDPVDRERLAYDQRVASANAFYDAMEARAGLNAAEMERIAALRNEELALLDEQLAETLEDLDATALAASLGGSIDRLLANVGRASRGTLDALTAQLEAWRRTYAGNEGVVELVDAALSTVGERYTELDGLIRERLEAQAAGVERLADAEAGGAIAQVARDRDGYAARLASVDAFYDDLVDRARGNADTLATIARQRNAEVADLLAAFGRELSILEPDELVSGFEAVTGAILGGIDTASRATLRSTYQQLQTWREAYEGDAGVVSIVDTALGLVDDRYQELTADVADSIDQLVTDSERIVDAARAASTRRDMSEIERLWSDTAEQINEAETAIAALEATLGDVTAEQAAIVAREVDRLRGAIGTLQRTAIQEARELAATALDAFEEGVQEVRARASKAAVDAVVDDVEDALRDVVAINEQAARSARNQLNASIADLLQLGFTEASLEPLRESVTELDDLLARVAENRAAFAREEYEQVRRVADAILSDVDARRVRLGTLAQEVALSKEALTEAEARAASLDDVRTATVNVTNAQLAYISALRSEVDALEDRIKGIRSALPALQSLGDALGRTVPLTAITAQRELTTQLFDQVLAAQRAGESFADYQARLQEATAAQTAFASTARTAIEGTFDDLARRSSRPGAIFNRDLQDEITDLAKAVGDTFDVSANRVRDTLRDAIREAAETTDPDFSFLDFLETRLQSVLGADYELDIVAPRSSEEVFDRLAESFADAPEAVAETQSEIDALEARITELSAEVERAINFEAIAAGALSGYAAVIERLEATAPADFAGIALAATTAFQEGFDEGMIDVTRELEDALGGAADVAGASAGGGLIGAFIRGLEQNKQELYRKVEEILEGVRDFLPSSDAKRGPLSDLTASGRALVTTFAGGVKAAAPRLERTMNAALRMPNVRPHSMAAAAAGAGAGGRGDTIINLPLAGSPAPAGIAHSAAMMRRAAEVEIRTQQRMGVLGRGK